MRWFSIRIYTPHPLPFRIDAKPQKRVAGCFPAYPVGCGHPQRPKRISAAPRASVAPGAAVPPLRWDSLPASATFFTKFRPQLETLSAYGSTCWKMALVGVNPVFWTEQLHYGQAVLAERAADPLRRPVETIMGCIGDYISTVALLESLGAARTTGNARRIARTMRALGYVPIKSRRLMPGGNRDTVARGWARPVRQTGCRDRPKEIVTLKPSHSNSSCDEQTQRKDFCHVL
jgi:hypothetical protein